MGGASAGYGWTVGEGEDYENIVFLSKWPKSDGFEEQTASPGSTSGLVCCQRVDTLLAGLSDCSDETDILTPGVPSHDRRPVSTHSGPVFQCIATAVNWWSRYSYNSPLPVVKRERAPGPERGRRQSGSVTPL